MTEVQWKAHVVAIPLERPDPLPGHQAPLDRRHRWLHRKRVEQGDWYRCRVCGKRKRVTDMATMLARKMRDTMRAMDDHLAETLWTA